MTNKRIHSFAPLKTERNQGNVCPDDW